jgi:hypothetical protein
LILLDHGCFTLNQKENGKLSAVLLIEDTLNAVTAY